MYEVFVNWLSPELMSQAEYINGVLYLPVYEFFSEVLVCLGTLFFAVVTFALITCFVDVLLVVGRWVCLLIRRFHENKHRVQQDNS